MITITTTMIATTTNMTEGYREMSGGIMRSFQNQVFSGNELQNDCEYKGHNPKFWLDGKNQMGQQIVVPFDDSLLSRHILLLGGIGTGKSNAFNFLIRDCLGSLTTDDVVIIFDTKGDFYKEFYQPGDVVISNDARACGTDGPDYWNIFHEVMIDERTEDNILEISKNFFEEKLEKTTQPFFPNAAKDLFSALMLHLVRDAKYEKYRNNQSLRNLFNTFSVPAMKNILSQHSDLQAMLSYIEDEKSGQTLGIVAELQQMVREIFIGNFAKRGTISLRQIVRNKGGKVVFIEYDLGIGSILVPVYRLLIDLAIKEALCRTANEGNVYFFIDEFRLLPHLTHIDDGVNFGRSLGAKFFFGLQNIDQIQNAYGEKLAQSILSGFGTTLAFRVNDVGSREYIKGLFGKNIKLQTFLSSVSTRGVVEQLRDGNVVEDENILDLPIGQCIAGLPGCEPFFFQFPLYR